MTLNQFKKIWARLPQDSETKTYEPCDKDKFINIGGYLFAIQKNGNVIMKKCEADPRFSLLEVFRAFRAYLIKNEIQYIRIEGTPRRYNFLKKMFLHCSILKDNRIKDRNVFYVKVFD